MTENERQLIAELLAEGYASPMDLSTLVAITDFCPNIEQLNDLQLSEVQRIAKESRR